MKIALFYGDDIAPQPGQVGTYTPNPLGSLSFTVMQTDGDICYAYYSNGKDGKEDSFIWRFTTGLNRFHDWPGKPHTDVDRSTIEALCKGLYVTALEGIV